MMRAFGDSAKKFGREVMRLNARLGAYDNQALDEIAQFPDISGPGIANKNFRGGVAELAHFLSIRGAEFSQEKSRQRGDVFLAVAQSRHVKGDHVQPVEKILAKGAARYLLFEMLVCRGDDAHVHAQCFVGSYALEALLLKHRSEEHTSELQSHSDLVCRLL